MVITSKVQCQFFDNDPSQQQQLIRIAQEDPIPNRPTKRHGTPWTSVEHNRFLHALEKYPSGPWKVIASYVETRTTRQTMTHAQKYREKIARHKKNSDLGEVLPRRSVSSEAVEGSSVESQSLTTADRVFGDELFPYSEDDMVFDSTAVALLESYEPLEIQESDPFLELAMEIDDDLQWDLDFFAEAS
ncbi:Myb domain-contaning protein [Globisporangium polare]